MTAPVAPTPVSAPAVVVAAPAPVEQQAPAVVETPIASSTKTELPERFGVDAIIASITKKHPVPTDDSAPAGDATQQASAPGEAAPSIDPLATPEGTAASAPQLVTQIDADIPEGKVELRARGEDGRFVEMDQGKLYELSYIDPSNGEKRVYEKKTLKDMSSMAIRSIHLQKLEPEAKYYRENLPKWQTDHRSLTQRAQAMEALAVELLTAPEDLVVSRREAYAQQFTPEARIKFLEAQLAERQAGQPSNPAPQQQQQQHASSQVAAFGQRAAPIIAEVEALVGPESAAGHLALKTAPLLVNGVLPADRIPQVEQYINGPFRQWARDEAAKRSSAATSAATQEAQRTLEQARQVQTAAQLAARSVGTATRPNAIGSTAPAPAPKPTNMRDMVDHIARRGGERRAVS